MKYLVKKIEGDEYLCPWTVPINISPFGKIKTFT